MIMPEPPPRPFMPAWRGGTIAIASGKGGVGKTWFAITLAQALAQGGRRTLLFDGDLGLANVDIQLGLLPRFDLGGYIAGRLTLPEVVTPYAEGGFDVIAGRSGTGSLAALQPARLHALGRDLEELAERYDVALLDLGAGVEGTVRSLAGSATGCLVLTTDEPTALADAYAFIKLACQENAADGIRIVINMAESLRDGERTYATLLRTCKGFLKFAPPLAGVVRRDRRVRESIRAQSPLLTRHPNSDAASDVARLVNRIFVRP